MNFPSENHRQHKTKTTTQINRKLINTKINSTRILYARAAQLALKSRDGQCQLQHATIAKLSSQVPKASVLILTQGQGREHH